MTVLWQQTLDTNLVIDNLFRLVTLLDLVCQSRVLRLKQPELVTRRGGLGEVKVCQVRRLGTMDLRKENAGDPQHLPSQLRTP